MTTQDFGAGVAPAWVDDARLAALIARVVQHDEDALLALYDQTARCVHAVVLRLTRDAAIAEEAALDTFWQVWREAPRFDPARGRPLAWLLTIARSRAIDAQRRQRRFLRSCVDDLAEGAAGTEPGAGPCERLAMERQFGQLHLAIGKLAAQDRELVVLAFFNGLSHDAIANQTTLPLGTVKSKIRRALRLLRQTLTDIDATREPSHRYKKGAAS